jgi:hypothetical protein
VKERRRNGRREMEIERWKIQVEEMMENGKIGKSMKVEEDEEAKKRGGENVGLDEDAEGRR